jgi:preprotein translocase subunit SecF
MWVVTYRKYFYLISIVLTALSVAAISAFGLKPGIEFTGGAILEVNYLAGRPTPDALKTELAKLEWQGTLVQETGQNGFIIRTKPITENERVKLINSASFSGAQALDVVRFDSVGPTIGAELRQKAWIAVTLVILAIVFFIAFAFRHVSEPVSSWVYGGTTVIALVHDVLIPTGLYVTLGHYFIDAQIDVLFITAILTVLGFSVHDSIVVFDRTRENLKNHVSKDFAETVGKSIEQTFSRSINTSLTVVLVTLALYLVGSETTKNFSLTLLVGVVAGTYSSIFLGSPLLVTIANWQAIKGNKTGKKK